jgi:hypothetical protein
VLYNYQLTPLGITSITVPTPYAVSGTCPITGGTLPPSSSCTISVTVTPPSVGALPAGSLTIITDAPNTPNTASLSGTAIAPVTVSPGTLAFGTVVANNAVTKNVTLTNYQGNSLTISSITGFPAGYTQGSVANSCTPGLVVAPGGNCVIAVTLTATSTGAQPGTISVNDNALNTPQKFTVSANAVAPVVLSPSTLSQTYTGLPLSVTATTNPTGLTVNFTYTGTSGTTYPTSSTAPTNAGSYTVVGTISSADYIGSATGTLVISPAKATVALTTGTHTYTGSAISATATTNPTGISGRLS